MKYFKLKRLIGKEPQTLRDKSLIFFFVHWDFCEGS